MRIKSILFVFGFGLFLNNLIAQDSQTLLNSYIRNFDKALDDRTRLELLEDAAKRNEASLAPLFKHALDYVVNKAGRNKRESAVLQIGMLATEQVEKFKHLDARWLVWQLFYTEINTACRIKCLKALGVIGKADRIIIQNLNLWLADQISNYKAGKKVELNVILRCVLTLGELEDASSFVVIFNTLITGFNQEISENCRKILTTLKGNFKELIISIIQTSTVKEKKEILLIALSAQSLKEEEKAEIAQLSLETALRAGTYNQQELKIIKDTRVLANRALAEFKWNKAVKTVLLYFEVILVEYEKALVSKQDLLEVIRCLGNMQTEEAAQKLNDYLELLNLYTEKKKVYDEAIVIETIMALGRLRNSLAFDVLMNVRYLPYNALVKAKAEEAIKNLK